MNGVEDLEEDATEVVNVRRDPADRVNSRVLTVTDSFAGTFRWVITLGFFPIFFLDVDMVVAGKGAMHCVFTHRGFNVYIDRTLCIISSVLMTLQSFNTLTPLYPTGLSVHHGIFYDNRGSLINQSFSAISGMC